ncbi:hypothetical protein PDE_01926 [Penicillium oxalicum 114-2]|uniref:Uncharacterized protein n=1 Tax=Penicillium oxalicum (strain 114-2 / CGMCC 5302) TaxID=933388 RepID=S7ZE64_PENO1|nr:hypothetical protein PDE_01926 [Penicillium oxalicum 114-2]
MDTRPDKKLAWRSSVNTDSSRRGQSLGYACSAATVECSVAYSLAVVPSTVLLQDSPPMEVESDHLLPR